MNGYVDGGYAVALLTLGTYAWSLLRREALARRRRGAAREQDAAAVPK